MMKEYDAVWTRLRKKGVLISSSEKLGKGAFASVYKARWLKAKQLEVAVKVINIEEQKKRFKPERVEEEIRIHSSLNHRSIVKLYDHYKDDKYMYILLEFCSNGDLEEYLKTHGRFSEEKASFILQEIVEGLWYLKEKRIMHRDLKLANILLTKDNHVKIADFGLAIQLKNDYDATRTFCGTVANLPPEVIKKEFYSFPADLWCLGCILYALVVGRSPFKQGGNGHNVFNNILQGDFEIPVSLNLSAQTVDLINRLLDVKEERRLTLPEIINHPFLKKASGLKISNALTSYDSGVSSSATLNSTCLKKSASESNINTHRVQRVQSNLVPKQHHASDNAAVTPKGHPYQHYSLSPICDATRSTDKCDCSKETNSCTSSCSCYHSEYVTCSKSCNRHGADSCKSNRGNVQSNSQCTQEVKACSHYGNCNLAYCSHLHTCSCRRTHANINTCHPSQHCSNDTNQHCNRSFNDNSHNKENKDSKSHPSTKLTSSSTPYHPSSSPPVTTVRLKPTRQMTKSAVVSILQSGVVSLEFLRGSVSGKQIISSVCQISSDFTQVWVFKPDDKNAELKEEPLNVPQEFCKVYNHNELPRDLFKKYEYAARFVKLVQSKTPKVTIYSPVAKVMLMESLHDIEASFYKGGKVSRNSGSIKIIDAKGKTLTPLSEHYIKKCYNPDVIDMWDHFISFEATCISVEAALSNIEKTPSSYVFPVIIGRRPTSADTVSSKNYVSPQPSYTSPAFSHVPSYDSSIQSSTPSATSQNSRSHNSRV